MSYDLYALALAAGEDPAQKLDRLENEALERPPDPEIERRRRDLAQALLSGTPELERAERDYTALADLMGITEEQAREGNRSIELGRAEIEVTLEDYHAWVEIQFGSPDRIPETLDGLRRILGILASEVGWSAYDPQLERVLDLDRDLDAVEAKLTAGAAHAETLSRGEWSAPEPAPAPEPEPEPAPAPALEAPAAGVEPEPATAPPTRGRRWAWRR